MSYTKSLLTIALCIAFTHDAFAGGSSVPMGSFMDDFVDFITGKLAAFLSISAIVAGCVALAMGEGGAAKKGAMGVIAFGIIGGSPALVSFFGISLSMGM